MKVLVLHSLPPVDPGPDRRVLEFDLSAGACGYLRVDVRLDHAGTPRVIDVNANPELSPEVGMHRAVTEAGWAWKRFVRHQVEWAI